MSIAIGAESDDTSIPVHKSLEPQGVLPDASRERDMADQVDKATLCLSLFKLGLEPGYLVARIAPRLDNLEVVRIAGVSIHHNDSTLGIGLHPLGVVAVSLELGSLLIREPVRLIPEFGIVLE